MRGGGRKGTLSLYQSLVSSVTGLADLLDFAPLFKAFGNNKFAQISYILRQFLWRCQNLYFFLWNHFWATFIDIWRFFSSHTACNDVEGEKEREGDMELVDWDRGIKWEIFQRWYNCESFYNLAANNKKINSSNDATVATHHWLQNSICKMNRWLIIKPSAASSTEYLSYLCVGTVVFTIVRLWVRVSTPLRAALSVKTKRTNNDNNRSILWYFIATNMAF